MPHSGRVIDTLSGTALEDQVLAHYRLVGPTLEQHFVGTPTNFVNFPGGFKALGHFHRTDIPFSEIKMLWLCHRMFAIEFHTWAPLVADRDRLRFARILLEDAPDADAVKEAALVLRTLLVQYHLEAAPMFDGQGGIALWIPLADAPPSAGVRAWLHTLCAEAVANRPDLFSTEPNTHNTGRVHVHVASNAPEHFSAMPYSARGIDGLPIATPIHWEELETLAGALSIDAFAQRFAAQGDIFGAVLRGIAPQNLPQPPAQKMMQAWAPRGSAITAAISILQDGGSLTAEQILDRAIDQHLVQPKMSAKYMYTEIADYITHTLADALEPQIIQNANRTFRINEPPDDWPQFGPPAPPVPPDALIARLESTATGDDPAAFEIAVCDAFAHLGFAATHVGGAEAPDGYADAQLGVLGYRLMIECKTAKGDVNQPDCVEASKFRGAYQADYCTIVGPAFTGKEELASELQTHDVTAFTVDDLRTLLTMNATAVEVRTLLKPGFAADFINDLVWERSHGVCKRISTIAYLVRREFWTAQVTAAQDGGRSSAPLLTVDSAMLLVDAALRTAGSTQACVRDDVVAAFTHLTDPLVAQAVWSDAAKTSLVVTAAV